MSYGNPHELLELVSSALPPRNELGHTAQEDFEYFCAYTGLREENVGAEAFAWAKLAFVSAWRRRINLTAEHSIE
jgi:hypothetical protein